MTRTKAAALALAILLPFAALQTAPLRAQETAQDAAMEAMQEYMMFAEYEAGVILPQQIDKTAFDAIRFIDTRSAAQVAQGTIPGALHIEWREVLDRIDEIPDEQLTVLFCNTGSLSAQASFALRVAGRSNVVVLQGGFEGWKQNAAWKP
ncbi:MAG: rhodanese-like domain-containing protein [Neomegalonema sp.]|nr:rhodanese-like domain-containing protein [Neomegalonema sp.]